MPSTAPNFLWPDNTSADSLQDFEAAVSSFEERADRGKRTPVASTAYYAPKQACIPSSVEGGEVPDQQAARSGRALAFHQHQLSFIGEMEESDWIHHANLVIPPSPRKSPRGRAHLQVLQEWEGCVTSIDENAFAAQLTDLTAADDVPTEQAVFDRDDIAENDLDLLRIGALFRWTIGYLRSPSGTKKRISQLVFRRLPQWTKRDLHAADSRAQELITALRIE